MVGIAGIVAGLLALRQARRDGEDVSMQARALLLAYFAALVGGVPAHHLSLPVHSTELHEAALGVLASLAALIWLRRGRRDATAFTTWIGGYAAGRLVLESLRGDVDRGLYMGRSTAQLVSL